MADYMVSPLASADLRPIQDKIMFKFEDEVIGKHFNNVTKSGIIFKGNDDSSERPRWGIVIGIGPMCKEQSITIGSRILIHPLKWTERIQISDRDRVWFTTPEWVMCIDDSV